jgi:RNA polymerase sigma-70 factor, ECF subfamily
MKLRMEKNKGFKAQALPQINDLYCTALYMLGKETDAQDLVQESFVTAYQSWHEYQINTNCRVWLFNIMANVLMNKYGSYNTLAGMTINTEEVNYSWARSKLANQPPTDGPYQISFPAISEDDVTQAIGNLPEDFKLITVLSLVQGFSCKEVADIVGIDP